jgi:DNA-binding winged helix-turn-helix (wHTH) protein
MRVRFDRFVIDSETRELLHGDDQVPLSPKAFDLLTILIAERPKALAKSDLLDRLWPGTFVVEKNLANLVGEIRHAIGDDAPNPRFLRTVHRFGYAFREPLPTNETRSRSSADDTFLLVKWGTGGARLQEGDHVLGRDPDVQILLDSPGVSRRHALIRLAHDGATVEDLGSKNGTFVGERRIEGRTPLRHGDTIGVGSVKLTVRVLRAPNSTETQGVKGSSGNS